MLFSETLSYLIRFIREIQHDQIIAISDDRLVISSYIRMHEFPSILIDLYEKTAGGLYGVKLYIYSEEFASIFQNGSYFYFPEGSKEDTLYRDMIKKHNYEIDLKFALPGTFTQSGLTFENILLISSPLERTANPELMNDFISIKTRHEFLREISNHTKYHTFFMIKSSSLQGSYLSNQTKLSGMLSLYKYFSNIPPERHDDAYATVKHSLSAEIQKIRFHFELLKKALFFGYTSFQDIRDDLEALPSIHEVRYSENVGGIEKDAIISGKVHKIYNRDDIIGFEKDSIMVAYNTNPEYMQAFLQAKLVIVENSSQLSHAAITCREFRIPGVLGAIGCMSLKNGDYISINTQDKIITLCQS